MGTFTDFGGSEGKASACSVGDLVSIPGSGRSLGEGSGNPLQYSCLENPMDGVICTIYIYLEENLVHIGSYNLQENKLI